MTRFALLTAALLAALAAGTPAGADDAVRCGDAGYSYAGVGGLSTSDGARTTLRLVSAPHVEAGHVAAWVGFGGHGAGRGGTTAWLQVGVIARPELEPTLYYEVAQPGKRAAMTYLGAARTGRSYRIAVREVRRGWWRAYVDGTAVSPAYFLPGSHGSWEATATAESWDDEQVVCNRFGFAFERMSVLRRNAWRSLGRRVTFTAPDYRVVRRGPNAFLARG